MIAKLNFFKIVLTITSVGITASASGESIYIQATKALKDSLLTQQDIETRLRDERQLFERQLDRHIDLMKHASELAQKSIDRTTQLSIYALIGIFVVGAIAYRFIFVNKLSEVREQIEDTFENRLREKLDLKLTSIEEHLNIILPDRIEKSVGGKLKDTESRIQQINEGLKSLSSDITAYKQRKFVWIFPGESSIAETEIKVLKEQGITNLNTLSFLPEQPIQIPDCNVIILSYDKSEHAYKLLEVIVETLRKRPNHVFLIIYTFNNGDPKRLDNQEMEMLRPYNWYQLASFPMTLISVAKTLVR